MSEILPGYATSTWLGIAAPGRTPAALVARLNRHVNAILSDAAVGARIAAAGGTVLTGAPAAFEQLIADDTVRWAHVLASATHAAS